MGTSRRQKEPKMRTNPFTELETAPPDHAAVSLYGQKPIKRINDISDAFSGFDAKQKKIAQSALKALLLDNQSPGTPILVDLEKSILDNELLSLFEKIANLPDKKASSSVMGHINAMGSGFLIAAKAAYEMLGEIAGTSGVEKPNFEQYASLLANGDFASLIMRTIKPGLKPAEVEADALPSLLAFVARNINNQKAIAQASRLSGKFDANQLAAFFSIFMSDTIKSCKSDSEKISMAKAMALQFEKLGITNFERYGEKVLESAYLTATDAAFSKGKKVAFVGLAKDDPWGSFADDIKTYESLLGKGYCIALCEAGTDVELAARFLENGVLDSNHSVLGLRTYDLVVLGGHGDSSEMWLGSGNIKIKDEMAKMPKYASAFTTQTPVALSLEDAGASHLFTRGAWSKKISKNASVVIMCCSSGSLEGEKKAGFSNTQQMFGWLMSPADGSKRIKFFAPYEASGLERLVYGDNGNVEYATYFTSRTSILVSGRKKG